MDSEIDEKKDLLKREILDNDYDQNKFIEFCTSKKENGEIKIKSYIDLLNNNEIKNNENI